MCSFIHLSSKKLNTPPNTKQPSSLASPAHIYQKEFTPTTLWLFTLSLLPGASLGVEEEFARGGAPSVALEPASARRGTGGVLRGRTTRANGGVRGTQPRCVLLGSPLHLLLREIPATWPVGRSKPKGLAQGLETFGLKQRPAGPVLRVGPSLRRRGPEAAGLAGPRSSAGTARCGRDGGFLHPQTRLQSEPLRVLPLHLHL